MSHRYSILIVDDEAGVTKLLKEELEERKRYEVDLASDGAEGINSIQKKLYDVVLLDMKMPRVDGWEVLQFVQEHSPSSHVIILSQYADFKMAGDTAKLGAYETLGKPYDIDQLEQSIERALHLKKLSIDNKLLQTELSRKTGTPELIGDSKALKDVIESARRVAASDSIVLIYGLSGTGKELFANLIHRSSARGDRPFVPVNCSSIPDSLLESELFGHEKGAFTGALERRTGCFELAEGGTLLLDEIGEMPIATQAKLLRVLEDRKLRRLGSKVETTVDVRVLAATNKVPEDAVAHGELRNDLYYRLNVFNIHMPPLREHREDIPDLVQSLLAEMSSKHSRRVATVSEAVLNAFKNYSWPGNVRELRNTLERAVIVCEGAVVETKHLPPGFGHALVRPSADDADSIRVGVGTTVGEAERLLIIKTLESTNNNKTRAAEILGISLKTLHNKLKEYGSADGARAEREEAEGVAEP